MCEATFFCFFAPYQLYINYTGMIFKKAIFTIAVLVFSMTARTQIVIDNSITLDEAIATLLGPNVVFSNVTFSGDANQLGYFDSANSNIGIPTGIILGTGDVTNAIGPNDSGSNSVGGGNFGASDSDLDQLDQLSHNDAAILEFDFVATGTAVAFDYVWASDEYPEYTGAGTCGNVSDVFGFFLSGPGITGPFSNQSDNIALIPGTNDFVSIFNLNAGCEGTAQPGDADCNNCEYYINNGDGFTAPFNGSDFYVQYDGFTVTLTAFFEGLQCGETYHIKLAVADVSDTAFDSAVFLKEGSFDVYGNLISAIVVNPSPDLGVNQVLEGCINGSFLVQPPGCQVEPLTITLEAGGTATAGEDYETFSTTITIQEDPVEIPVTTISDMVDEGMETITLSFTYTDLQGNEVVASAELELIDYTLPTLSAVEDLRVCPGATEVASTSVSDGFPPFAYSWTSGETGTSASYSQGEAGEYSVTVTDYCGNTNQVDFVVTEPEPFVFVDSVELCFQGTSQQLVEGGELPYTYIYNDLGLALVEPAHFTGVDFGIWPVVIEDACGQIANADIYVVPCGTTIPNIFTPNGDDNNQYFEIVGVERFPGSVLTVWNRWGTIVYESQSYRNRWDGDDLPEGTYYYVFTRSDGETSSGAIMLLRGK